MSTPPPFRVVQWATGTIGRRSLRAILAHPGMTLAGVYVHSPDKAGRDAGELCGTDPVGVTATTDIEQILALDADCVLYMPITFDADEVCRLLAAGFDVVTTCGRFHHPETTEPGLRARVAAACAEGGASIHSTGSSPGFITEAIPLALTSVQRELTGLTIDEYADLSRRPSPELLFGIMGFGGPAQTADPSRAAYLRDSFGPSLRLVARALGLPLDDLTAHAELACAHTDVDIAAGRIPAGTVAAQRITVTGVRAGAPLLTFRATWYCTADLDADWRIGDTGWHLSVDGDAPLEVDIRLAVDLDRMAQVSPGYTAHRAVNAVPAVCAAEPGIRSSVELPQIIADFRPRGSDPLSSIP
ncbi:NAD(P)H-dependent amine dehydrogenase family protein [Nocardia shimofusensis]|uniref:NAD(P)H-dependent amine dehydrogenase family protein n=1 Tax=Nocardia shimofusensis TaxID=228596 RepID=UPI00082E4EBA|nr:dihydrodipicolinate reductase [Nocardia shimofusensis]